MVLNHYGINNISGSFTTSMHEGSFWYFLLQNYIFILQKHSTFFFISFLLIRIFVDYFFFWDPDFLALRVSCMITSSWAIAFVIWGLSVLKGDKGNLELSFFWILSSELVGAYISCLPHRIFVTNEKITVQVHWLFLFVGVVHLSIA